LKVLNVGGGAKGELPERYKGWEHVLLDIDPNVHPDILLDAREMETLPPEEYDAIICSHNLEHFYKHEVRGVLKGFLHVLKDDGFAEITVPHLTKLMETMQANHLDITDVWYRTAAGMPITFHDAIYGWSYAMEKGNLFFAHRCGWTKRSLCDEIMQAGFEGGVQLWEDNSNIYTIGFKREKKSCQ